MGCTWCAKKHVPARRLCAKAAAQPTAGSWHVGTVEHHRERHLYVVLGVPASASAQEIKQAFRGRAKAAFAHGELAPTDAQLFRVRLTGIRPNRSCLQSLAPPALQWNYCGTIIPCCVSRTSEGLGNVARRIGRIAVLSQAARQAYEVLIDPDRRARYDQGGLNAHGLGIDSSLFDAQPRDGRDINVRATLPFEIAAFGGVHRVVLERQGPCSSCSVRRSTDIVQPVSAPHM